jgi:RHS repeat-associated protein
MILNLAPVSVLKADDMQQPWHSGGTGGPGGNPGGQPGDLRIIAEPPQNAAQGAEPVTFNNGEIVESFRDLFIPSRELPIDIARTYRSQSQYNGLLGYGWDLNYNIRIKKLNDGSVFVLDGTGRKDKYERSSEDVDTYVYTAPRGIHNALVEFKDTYAVSAYILRRKSGIKYHFDRNGHLIEIESCNENKVTFTYDSAGKLPIIGIPDYTTTPGTTIIAYTYRLTKITDTVGREILLSYNTNGRLEKITDFEKRTITYSYDAMGNLVKVTNPVGHSITYGYDENHNLTSITDAKGVTYLVNVYDDSDRIISQTYHGGTFTFQYDADNLITRVTDRIGTIHEYYFNETGNPIKVIQDVDGLNLVSASIYDDNMNLLSEINPAGDTTSYTYDSMGNLLTITDTQGNVTTFTYESTYNHIASVTDALGRTSRFEYDTKGNIVKIIDALGNETIYTYDTNGDLLSITNADEKTTSFTYNSQGYPTTITNPLGHLTRFNYNAFGKLTAMTDARGNTTSYSYDILNRLVEVIDTLGNKTKYTYDENNNRTSIIDAQNQTTKFVYDEFNRLVIIRDALGHERQYTYDLNENLLTTIDANNNSTTNAYDALERLIAVTDSLGNKTEYSYDKSGNVKQITDARRNTTTHTYDNLDRLIQTTYPDGSVESYVYNKVGNLASKTDRIGQTINYKYDELDRIILKTYPDSSSANYSYDNLGRLTKATYGDSSVSYNYDALSRITQSRQNEKTINYTYDDMANSTRLTYPDGDFITYVYDALNRLDQIKDSVDLVIADYTYDSLSRRTQLDLSNGTQTTYAYDVLDSLTKLINKKAPDYIISSFTYEYDPVGNRISMTTEKGVHSYTYDATYQLTGVTYPDSESTAYHFDAVGNRTSVVAKSTTDYTTNELNEYTEVGGVAYSYDANGNLTSDGVNSYEYDYENRLTKVITPEMVISYGYDVLGRRVSKSTPSGITKYIYDGNRVIVETDGAGVTTSSYIYGMGVDEVLIMTSGENHYFYHLDGLGSVVNITDASGKLVESYSYDVYGEPGIFDNLGNRLEKSVIGNSYLFTGRVFDKECDLYYYRTRYYKNEIGRFITPDAITWGPDDIRLSYQNNTISALHRGIILSVGLDDPSYFHRLAYVSNSPVNYVDPTGELLIAAFGIGAIIGGTISAYDAYTKGENVISAFAKGALAGGVGAVVATWASVAFAGYTFAGYTVGWAVAAGLGGGASNFTRQVLEIGFEGRKPDYGSFVGDVLISVATAGLFKYTPLKALVRNKYFESLTKTAKFDRLLQPYEGFKYQDKILTERFLKSAVTQGLKRVPWKEGWKSVKDFFTGGNGPSTSDANPSSSIMSNQITIVKP